MFLRFSAVGFLFLVITNAITVSGKEREKRDDTESESVGDMISNFMSKLFQLNSNDTTQENLTTTSNESLTTSAPPTTSEKTTTTAKLFQLNSNDTTQENLTTTSNESLTTSAPPTTSEKTTTTSQTTKAPKQTTKASQIASTSSKTSTLTSTPPQQAYMNAVPPEPEICQFDPLLSNFYDKHELPEDLNDITFWDLYSVLFSDVVLETMMADCSRGEWCLRGPSDYWDALIAERVYMVMKSEIASHMCQTKMEKCIADITDNFTDCSVHEQMVYAAEAIKLICKLKQNPGLTSACYERTLQALHVTLADVLRGINENEEKMTTPDDKCQQPEAHMTRGIICIANSCPGEAATFESFQPWAWFTGVVKSLIVECNLNTTVCEGLLQHGSMEWMYDYDVKVMIGVSVVSLITLLLMMLIGCTFWRRYRRNVVLKEGYQQLLNEGDES